MSNNELYEHKRSDTVKWVLTLFAFGYRQMGIDALCIYSCRCNARGRYSWLVR